MEHGTVRGLTPPPQADEDGGGGRFGGRPHDSAHGAAENATRRALHQRRQAGGRRDVTGSCGTERCQRTERGCSAPPAFRQPSPTPTRTPAPRRRRLTPGAGAEARGLLCCMASPQRFPQAAPLPGNSRPDGSISRLHRTSGTITPIMRRVPIEPHRGSDYVSQKALGRCTSRGAARRRCVERGASGGAERSGVGGGPGAR